jgi:hypothetical protein
MWWVNIVTAFVAASTASVGYFITNRAKLTEGRRATYASALLAVETYKGLPYRIRRRTDSKPEVRGELGALISDAERDLDYYMLLLDLDRNEVALRFRALAVTARMKGTVKREEAWSAAPISTDAEMRFKDEYGYDDEHEIAMCKAAMFRRLRLWALH